jgi:hypothetical protein
MFFKKGGLMSVVPRSVDERGRRVHSRINLITKNVSVACTIALVALVNLTSCLENIGGPDLKEGPWQKMKSGTEENLRGVWGLESGELFAVGDNGTILYFDGDSWFRMESGTTANLVGVWAGAADNAVATGEGGTILYYDGVVWSPLESGTTADIGAVWGVVIAPWMRDQLPLWLYAVGGGPPATILQFDGLQWQSIDTGGSDELLDIMGWVSATGGWPPHLVAVGANGSARYFDGSSWNGTETGVGEDLVAIFGDSPDNVFAIGRNGTVIQNTERFLDRMGTGAWHEVAHVEGNGLSDIAARHYNDLFLVGADGLIVNFDRLELTDMRSHNDNTLHGVWAGDTDVFTVGDAGTILRYSREPGHRHCPINVSVTVAPGATPVIDWSPPCPVSKIVIEDTFGDVQWFAEADGNLIYPAVEWGTAPPGTVERRMSLGPSFGNSLYRVSLIRRDWDREILIGAWNVIPLPDEPNAAAQVVSSSSDFDYDARMFHFQRLVPTGTGPDRYSFGELAKVPDGDWRMIADPGERESALNVRPIVLEVLHRDLETGEIILMVFLNVRIAELPGDGGTIEVLWDWEDN